MLYAYMLTTHLHLVLGQRMHGAIPPLPQYAFMAWHLVKHRDNFTFMLIYIFFFAIYITVHTEMYRLTALQE